jgi:hypothetical protein
MSKIGHFSTFHIQSTASQQMKKVLFKAIQMMTEWGISDEEDEQEKKRTMMKRDNPMSIILT